MFLIVNPWFLVIDLGLIEFILQFLDAVRSFDGYCSIRFPHCSCDARKDGPVILVVSLKYLQLKACQDDGTPLVCYVLLFVSSIRCLDFFKPGK